MRKYFICCVGAILFKFYNSSQDFVFGVQEIAYCAYGNDFWQPDGEHLSALDEDE